MKLFVDAYTNNPAVIILPTGSRWNTSVRKMFVSNFWSVCESVVNKFIDSFTGGTYAPKKN
jgi:hypothetical protein